jgi:hypothetical protein
MRFQKVIAVRSIWMSSKCETTLIVRAAARKKNPAWSGAIEGKKGDCAKPAWERGLRLARTPYVLLRSFPGINVVRASEFAREKGPISNYANSRTITGCAGLGPSRYQSDLVDHASGFWREA